MSRLIDADYLKDVMCHNCVSRCTKDECRSYCECVVRIDQCPTAYDTQEVIKQIRNRVKCYKLTMEWLTDTVRRGGLD